MQFLSKIGMRCVFLVSSCIQSSAVPHRPFRNVLVAQDELLDVIHWQRQILAIVCGIAWGAIPLTGLPAFLGQALTCNAVISDHDMKMRCGAMHMLITHLCEARPTYFKIVHAALSCHWYQAHLAMLPGSWR